VQVPMIWLLSLSAGLGGRWSNFAAGSRGYRLNGPGLSWKRRYPPATANPGRTTSRSKSAANWAMRALGTAGEASTNEEQIWLPRRLVTTTPAWLRVGGWADVVGCVKGKTLVTLPAQVSGCKLRGDDP